MKRLWQGFLRVPGYAWLLGLIGMLFLDGAIDEDRGAAFVIWGIAWFFLLATLVAALAVGVRLLGPRRREVRWHQGVFALIALVIVGFVAVRVVAGGERAEIEDVVERVLTADDPNRSCYEDVTYAYLGQLTDMRQPYSDELCVQIGPGLADADEVEFGDLDIAEDRDSATLVVDHLGGALSGSTAVYGLVDVDDEWRVHRLITFVHFDKAGMIDSFREDFVRLGASEDEADCAVRSLARRPSWTLEEAIVSPRPAGFTKDLVRCARSEIERSLRANFDAPPNDQLPDAQVACEHRVISKASDAELIRLYDDPEAYGIRLLSCGRDNLEQLTVDYVADELDLDTAEMSCLSGRLAQMGDRAYVRFSYDQSKQEALISGCTS